jgi:2-amino-4-hydroxy-6-hydroxymethyldihydropteridine diphosphokinase
MDFKDYIEINGLKISCIIGIFNWERTRKQVVSLDLKFPCDNRKAAHRDRIEDTVDYKKIAKFTISFAENSSFQLVETMAEKLAEMLLERFQLPEIYLSVSKPGAIRGSQNVGVQIHRFRLGTISPSWMALSLGSNINPKLNLLKAMEELENKFGLLGSSHVYETSPLGFSRQPNFWNSAIIVRDPGGASIKIRNFLGLMEIKAGRKRTSNPNGPRTLDVDLLLRANQVELSGKYKIPHPDLEKKAFVLFPLLEVIPTETHPVSNMSFVEIAASFKDKKQIIRRLPKETLAPFYPFGFTR